MPTPPLEYRPQVGWDPVALTNGQPALNASELSRVETNYADLQKDRVAPLAIFVLLSCVGIALTIVVFSVFTSTNFWYIAVFFLPAIFVL